MSWYLVESYAPRDLELAEVDARIADTTGSAGEVTHLASILLPDDETCFHLFDAADRELVADLSEAAGLHPLRIVETVHREHLR